jgi:uncharacterized protein with NAD-binding domain and iron-sulfur cluster
MSNPYNSQNVPARCRVLTMFDKDGAELGDYVFENINLSRPDKVLKRPNQISSSNGWDMVTDQAEGSATMQIATSATTWPRSGAYFEEDLGYGTERWVIHSPQQPFEMDGYWKQNVSLILDEGAENFA